MEILKACEVKLSYNTKVRSSERFKISSSQDIYRLLMEYVFDEESIEYRESLKVVLLNRANKVLGFHTVSFGGTSECIADVKIIMQAAILSNASTIILAHNHPSGHLFPSTQDDKLTQKVRSACEVMDIALIDHLIVSKEGYYSYADECRLINN
jgi:DNA repair protein RadC